MGNRWVHEILELQHDDGSWGCFHTLSQPARQQPITTEQALRRLRILGLSKEDEPIRRAIGYMERCLAQPVSPVFNEKIHDAKIFSDLMLSAWLRLFEPNNAAALPVARRWANIIEAAFANGGYDHSYYVEAYKTEFGIRPQGGRLVDFVSFYPIALLQGLLTSQAEDRFLDYVLSHKAGIYYIYGKPLNVLPDEFASRQASCYIAAMELLSGYNSAPVKLGFATDWIMNNRDNSGQWDMGIQAKDGIYFPLSDSWRKAEDRRQDCTARVKRLLNSGLQSQANSPL